MGGKTREKNFSRNRFRKQTTMEKNRLEKVRKQVFYKHTNIVTKNGGKKTREKCFSKNTRISRVINDGKNRLEKVRKQVFYKHINNVTKNGGKNSRKNFFEKHRFRKQTTLKKKSS